MFVGLWADKHAKAKLEIRGNLVFQVLVASPVVRQHGAKGHTWGQLHKRVLSSSLNLVKIDIAVIIILMIKSDHNFVHVTTAELSWRVQNCDLIETLYFR